MASVHRAYNPTQMDTRSSAGTTAVIGIAFAIAVVHLLTNGRYGFHRDELQTLSDALHMDWGFVPYPPLTPFLERMSLEMFGVSLVGLRLFSVLAQSAAIVATGLMARELGGGRWAQAAAALGVAVSPLPLFEGTEFQYTTFDYLWWVLTTYFVIRLLKTENPRWCLAIGAVVGIGLMTKYTIAFFVAGILIGLLLTRARRYLASRWFWAGVALAVLIFLPNLLWQLRHDFISLHFLRYIHARDVGEGRAEGFWQAQFLSNANRYAAPLWIAGLIGFLLNQRYRTLTWMYLTPVAIFWLTKGRGYYTGAAYPMLMAMGGATIEGWLKHLPRLWRGTIQAAYLVALTAWGVYVSTVILPLASSGPLLGSCSQQQRGLARGNRVERIGQDSRCYSGLFACRAAAECWGVGRQLRGAGRNRDPRSHLPIGPTDQRDQLGLAARISRVTALSIDCCRAVASIRRANAYLVPPCRP